MKTLRVLAACALLSSTPPSFAQISAGVGHQLKEKAPDGSDASSPRDSVPNSKDGLSEGRAAAPGGPVGDKANGASSSGDDPTVR